jgi:hypothetical protein
VGCSYAAGAFSFWSVLGLFLGNDNNGVVFSLGSVPRWYLKLMFLGRRGEWGDVFLLVRSEAVAWQQQE